MKIPTAKKAIDLISDDEEVTMNGKDIRRMLNETAKATREKDIAEIKEVFPGGTPERNIVDFALGGWRKDGCTCVSYHKAGNCEIHPVVSKAAIDEERRAAQALNNLE